MTIRTIIERVAYENKYVRVLDNDVEFPSGQRGTYLRIEQHGSGTPVVVLATHDGRVALVRLYRYALCRYVWELPRGGAEGDVFQAARTELVEETGAVAGDIRLLGTVCPDDGLLATSVTVVHIECVSTGAGPEGVDEIDDVRWVAAEEFRRMLRDGDIEDGLSYAAYAMGALHGVL